MSNSSYAFNLIVASQRFFTYSTYIIFGLGLIGNLTNILVFTNLKIFHHNRCAFYLIVESILGTTQVTLLCINEIWKLSIDGVEPETVSLVWCKVRTIIPQSFRLLSASIVCFVAIDQFLSTNPVAHFRQLSSLKIAQYQIFFAAIPCLMHTLPFAVYLEIRPLLGCVITNPTLTRYFSYFFYPFLNGSLPITVSSLFSILAYRNVRRIIRRQIPIDRRRLDQQLTAMIFARVIFFILLQLPYTLYRICTLNLTIVRANTIEYATVTWIQVISTTLIYSGQATNFYIFFAISARYRRQVKYFLVKKCWQPLKCWDYRHQNTVQPLDGSPIESGTELS